MYAGIFLCELGIFRNANIKYCNFDPYGIDLKIQGHEMFKIKFSFKYINYSVPFGVLTVLVTKNNLAKYLQIL